MPIDVLKAQIDQFAGKKPIHIHDLHRTLNLPYAELVKSLETKNSDTLIVFELEQIEALNDNELQSLLENFYLLSLKTLGSEQVGERFREFQPNEPANLVLHEIQHAKKAREYKKDSKIYLVFGFTNYQSTAEDFLAATVIDKEIFSQLEWFFVTVAPEILSEYDIQEANRTLAKMPDSSGELRAQLLQKKMINYKDKTYITVAEAENKGLIYL